MRCAYKHTVSTFCKLIILFMLVAMAACSVEQSDKGSSGSSGATELSGPESVTTVASDAGPSTDEIVTVEVTSSDGSTIRVLAEANGLIVRFREPVTSSQQRSVLAAASSNLTTQFSIVDGLTHVTIDPDQTLDLAFATLSSDPSVVYVEPNYIVSTQAMPNDPRFNSQWGLNNTGQSNGVVDADIDAPEAWDLSTGNDTIIAVIDTGVDYNHPDLAANMWTNLNEIPNNGRDDDGNGYVDDVRGWDFSNDDNNPIDDNNHGTHVAGVIAAEGNNGTGIAGVNWSAQIMPLKFMNARGQGNTLGAIRAIQYAVANGARVSNNSWGGPGFSRSLYDAVAAANSSGHIFVTAAGNTGNDNDSSPNYPASFNLANIISVASTDRQDRRSSFSNYGASTVDVGAPGSSILSTIRSGNYATFSGTSMASPYVAGVAGLMLAKQSNLSVAEVKSILISTVDPISSLSGRSVSGGRVNVFNALSQITSASPSPAPSPAPVAISINPTAATLLVGDSRVFSASGGQAPYAWSLSNNSIATISSTGQLTAFTSGNTTVTATDANGIAATSGTIVINEPTPDPIILSPSTGAIGVGQTLQFTATGGVTPYSWSSSNATIAMIDPASGLLTGLAVGSVIVSLIDNTGVRINSGNLSVSAVRVSPSLGVLPVAENLQLTATGGTPPYAWRSSNNTIVQVSNTGFITTVSPGTAVVTATDANGFSATTGTIVVRSVQITPSSINMLLGDTMQFSASGGAAPYLWETSDPSIATIDANGLLTSLTAGSIYVYVSDADSFGAATDAILISNGSVVISITPSTANVPYLGWQLFSASGGTPPYTWRVRNPSAGFIYTATWPGWFYGNGAIGSTTTIIAIDANGNVAETGTVTVVR